MNNTTQEIYINLDDSGKLTFNEKISVYGGLLFFSKKEKDKFITQYRSIINSIKCKYCRYSSDVCNKKCPEIKNTNIRPSDKRRIMNYIKKYYVIALIIKNDDVYEHIKNNKAAKGRFTDYAIRRLIKETINSLVKSKGLKPDEPIKLIINIDQQSTKSNGYYNLHDGLFEELKVGFNNFNYSFQIKPALSGDLEIDISYQDSGKSYVVQAADLLAGTIRKKSLDALLNNCDIHKELSEFVDFKIILP
ncbi:MAG: hypothetical protein E7159_04920 [Firmicutes bacterium]|nr:hypothetical protein [Bacillota bacterium]